MVFTNPWDESDPPGSQDANTADTEIQQVKLDIRERIETVLKNWTVDAEDPKQFPGWLIRKAGNNSVADSTSIIVAWDAEDRDTDGFHAAASTDIVVPAGFAGMYVVGFSMGWAPSATGVRTATLRLNTADVAVDKIEGISGLSVYNRLERSIILADADILNIELFQTSGGILTFGNVDVNSELVVFYGIRIGG